MFNAQSDMEVVGQSTDYTELMRVIRQHHPQVVLLDWDLRGLPIVDPLFDLKVLAPPVKWGIMSSRVEVATSAFRAGASGFICKTDLPETVLRIVRMMVQPGVQVRAATREADLSEVHVTKAQAQAVGQELGVRWGDVDLEEFREGLEVELENAYRVGSRNDWHAELPRIGQLVLANLRQQPDYYSRSIQVETALHDQPGG